MEPVAISWLMTSAASPLVAVLALWTVYVFHTYRRRWRTVDLFLLAVAAQELITAIFTFSYAILNLIHPRSETPCSFIHWGLISTRTFQVATLSSMVVDRALTVRWPYKYRFSVRRNQIRYHITVLAMIAVLVGVAAVFAQVASHSGSQPLPFSGILCSSHPIRWDLKFIVFILVLYGVLIVASLGCMVRVEVHRCRSGPQTEGPFQLPECGSPELPAATMTSPLDSESSTGSTRALHKPSRQSSRRPYGKHGSGTADFRWTPVAAVSLICFAINHLPYLVLTSMATVLPQLWTSWHDAILSWIRLVEGVVVPLVFCLTDQCLRNALKRTFQRRSGALSPLVGDDGPFQMYFDKDHFHKRGTFGSVTPIGIITNYRRTPGKKRRSKKSNTRYVLPGHYGGDSVLDKSVEGLTKERPISKLSCADLSSLGMWREDDEVGSFYATLSDDFSTFSGADDSTISDDVRISEELYGGSFTTIANDDFEFHDTRPCGGEVRMRPSIDCSLPTHGSFHLKKHPEDGVKGTLEQRVNISDDLPSKKPKDQFAIQTKGNEEDEGSDMSREASLKEQVPRKGRFRIRPEADLKNGQKMGSRKMSSYSMNDLNLIDGDSGGEETVFVLPVKSGSNLSLYRLHVDHGGGGGGDLLTSTKSETNLTTGDSGFGSGSQGTAANPPWSVVVPVSARNEEDPFWDLRRLSSSSPWNKEHLCMFHPRMKRIPWISAWKKLDEGSGEGRKRTHYDDKPTCEERVAKSCKQRQRYMIQDWVWKENVAYEQRKNVKDKDAAQTFRERNLCEEEGIFCDTGSVGMVEDVVYRDDVLREENQRTDERIPESVGTGDVSSGSEFRSAGQRRDSCHRCPRGSNDKRHRRHSDSTRRESGEATRDVHGQGREIFPFDTFLKPNPPFVPSHGNVKAPKPDILLNFRQKKIAITDFL